MKNLKKFLKKLDEEVGPANPKFKAFPNNEEWDKKHEGAWMQAISTIIENPDDTEEIDSLVMLDDDGDYMRPFYTYDYDETDHEEEWWDATEEMDNNLKDSYNKQYVTKQWKLMIEKALKKWPTDKVWKAAQTFMNLINEIQ